MLSAELLEFHSAITSIMAIFTMGAVILISISADPVMPGDEKRIRKKILWCWVLTLTFLGLSFLFDHLSMTIGVTDCH